MENKPATSLVLCPVAVSVHLLKKWRHFVSPKTSLCFRVGLGIGSWGWGYRKYAFG